MSQINFFIRTILVLALMTGLFVSASAQSEKKTAQRFDDFGDILYSDLIARLDNFAIQLMNQSSARGFLVVYRSPRDLAGLNHALAMRMKRYLVQTRGLPKDRIVTVDGGPAGQLVQELWVVEPGTAPIPRSDAKIGYVQNPDSAWKFYEHGFLPLNQYKQFEMKLDREMEAEDLETYANEVKKEPGRLAVVIIYAQFNRKPGQVDWVGDYDPRGDIRLDLPGTARQELNRLRDYLINYHGVAASKIKLIDGGHRKQRWVEFWIVPAGEPLPVATPNSYPNRRKK